MYLNIVDILEYDKFRIRLLKYERKKEIERMRERCVFFELLEFLRIDLS